jgi:glycosyltransferase involved in cell wall biosynthesis
MHVLLIEPYYGGSHRTWADGYRDTSRHTVSLLTLPAQFWKWRMQGGAVTLARQFQNVPALPDAILASDMVNLATFRALTRDVTAGIPIALYFHENQLTYPQNTRQGHGWRYGFVNYVSALAADAVYFNSQFHLEEFFTVLPRMLKHFGDHNELESATWLRERAGVLPVGVDFGRLDQHHTVRDDDDPPIILWNHRWEADKNPGAFFRALDALDADGVDFRLVLLGENFSQAPKAFDKAHRRFASRILHYGYAADFATYARWLWRSDWVVSTALHDFFGVAMAEAIYCGCVPILPRRLNYPALVPDEWHPQCLYGGNRPEYLLRAHLTGEIRVPAAPLQAHIARYDWRRVAAQYDDALEHLVQNFRGAPPLDW